LPQYKISEDEGNNVLCEPPIPYNVKSKDTSGENKERKPKIKVKLRDGKEREIQHIVSTSFWSTDGRPIFE
jgi:type I restriction enzyme R subunit